MDQIERVRDFNRYYTQRLGVLTDRYLGQSRPLGEARLLFEIGPGADLRTLRARLGLDSGYLSRLLRTLELQGLVAVQPHPSDGRVRIAVLTPAGSRERAELEARSRDSVAELLGQLTPAQRDRLIEAQGQIRHLLRLAGVTVDAVADSSPEARECLRAYAGELAVRFPEGYSTSALLPPGSLLPPPGPGMTPDPVKSSSSDGAGAPAEPGLSGGSGLSDGSDLSGGSDALGGSGLPDGPGSPDGPVEGAFLVAREEGRALGCGVWQLLEPGVAEIRHLWVSEEARGLGLGRRLLEALESDAAGRGVTTLRLGTHPSLPEAIKLYRSSGYREIPSYGSSPYNQLNFEKPL